LKAGSKLANDFLVKRNNHHPRSRVDKSRNEPEFAPIYQKKKFMAIFLAFYVPNLLICDLLILNQFLIGMTDLVKSRPKTAGFNRNIPLQCPFLSRDMGGGLT